MQCDAEYRIYDKDGDLALTFYCMEEMGHDGCHTHELQWKNFPADKNIIELHLKP